MLNLLIFIDRSKAQEHFKAMLKKLMVDVIGICEDELLFHYWPGIEKATELIQADEPDLTFICGEEALNQMLRVKGIRRMSGKLRDWNAHLLVPLLSPGYIENHPSELAPYAESIQKAYMTASGEGYEEPTNDYVLIKTFQEFLPYFQYLKQASWLTYDYETTSLTDMGTFDPGFRLRGLAITYQIGSAIFIDLENMPADDTRQIAKALDEVFGDPNIVKIAHNAKFDLQCAAKMGVTKFRGQFHDTMLMSQLLDENTPNGLKYLVSVYFPAFAGYEDKLQSAAWEHVPMERLAPYSALDSDLTLRLYLLFTNIMLEKEPRIYNLYRNLTAPAMMALLRAELNGMKVDVEYLDQAIKDTELDIFEQEKKLRSNTTVIGYQKFRNEEATKRTISDIQDRINRENERTFAENSYDRRDARVRGLETQIKGEKDAGRVSKLMDRIRVEKAKTYGITPAQARDNRVKELEKKIAQLHVGEIIIDEPLNFASPQQMNDLIYGPQGFNFNPPRDPITDEYKTGTGKEVLNYISDRSGFLDNLLAFRQLQKILSTYLVSIKNKLDSNGYIHTNFNQHVTKTGRLSSDKPNLQNIISRTKYKVVEEAVKRVKRVFSVPSGYSLCQYDYSQAELRLIAHYSQDSEMMKAYRNNQDLHELTAARARDMTLDKFRALDEKERKQFRFEAKADNFGLIYGMSAGGYRNYARVEYGIILSRKQAEERRNSFFRTYPSLLKYHHLYKAKAHKYGHVRTMFGRKVRLPDLKSFNSIKSSHAERNAINSPIQGTAGEMTIFAFALLQPILDARVLFVNTIHDSILYYIPNDILEQESVKIKYVMENLPIEKYFDKTLSLPMKADEERSQESWGQLAS